jgi:hypothetical protein
VNFFCVFLEYQTMDRAQKPSNSECYAPSSEPTRNQGCMSQPSDCPSSD